MNKPLQRAVYIYKNEGLSSLIRRAFLFIKDLVPFEYSTFYLQERVIGLLDSSNLKLPVIENIYWKTISNDKQLDELINEGFDLSRLDLNQVRYRLEKGATILLIFSGHELAYRSWTATTEEAKNTLTKYPFKVNFASGESYGGDYWTNPIYRRKGLNTYAAYKRDEYLLADSVKNNKTIVTKDNVASLRASTKHGTKIYGKARYIRIFGIKYWQETPLN